MPKMYSTTGEFVGNIGEEQEVPSGYFIRPDTSEDSMSPLDFLDKIGPQRFGAVWMAALQNPAIAFPMVRGFAAQLIHMKESFPSLLALEAYGILPQGTALEIWST